MPRIKQPEQCCLYLGESLARYGFGNQHPFDLNRHKTFQQACKDQGLLQQLTVLAPQIAKQPVIELFHQHEYVERVKQLSITGNGFLDQGDTPAFKGVFEAASTVVGSVCDAIDRIMDKQYRHAFVPIAGLHHARREQAAGFCVFNDCGVAIEYLRQQYQLKRIAYVDIDAHHGDGVFYSFEQDADLIFADLHEDGHYLYPGTGDENETGKAEAIGRKLNIPMPPGATDADFFEKWPDVENLLTRYPVDFIILQCGADSLKDDPLTHLQYTEKAHAYAAERLCLLAEKYCHGRILAAGGGGYNHKNIAKAWTAVVKKLIRL